MEEQSSKRKRQSLTEHEPSRSQQAPHVSNEGEKSTQPESSGMASSVSESAERPWHAAFPAPTLTAGVMPQRRAFMTLSMKIASLLIVDVRRTDYEGGFIRGSINIPAQGFWWNRGMLYELAYKADMEWVVFACGSSNGRAPRCAGWFLDHVRNTVGDEDMQVMVLEGGIKGWIKAGSEYTALMDGYQEDFWKQFLGVDEEEAQEPQDLVAS